MNTDTNVVRIHDNSPQVYDKDSIDFKVGGETGLATYWAKYVKADLHVGKHAWPLLTPKQSPILVQLETVDSEFQKSLPNIMRLAYRLFSEIMPADIPEASEIVEVEAPGFLNIVWRNGGKATSISLDARYDDLYFYSTILENNVREKGRYQFSKANDPDEVLDLKRELRRTFK